MQKKRHFKQNNFYICNVTDVDKDTETKCLRV